MDQPFPRGAPIEYATPAAATAADLGFDGGQNGARATQRLHKQLLAQHRPHWDQNRDEQPAQRKGRPLGHPSQAWQHTARVEPQPYIAEPQPPQRVLLAHVPPSPIKVPRDTYASMPSDHSGRAETSNAGYYICKSKSAGANLAVAGAMSKPAQQPATHRLQAALVPNQMNFGAQTVVKSLLGLKFKYTKENTSGRLAKPAATRVTGETEWVDGAFGIT